MKIKFISDFHTEFWPDYEFEDILEKYLPYSSDDAETTLCCGGDMGVYAKYADTYAKLFELLSSRFKDVVAVPGNHSYYRSGGIWNKESEFWKKVSLPANVWYLDNNYVVLSGVLILGSCLWSDFDSGSHLAMFHAGKSMNDYRCIRKRAYEINGPYGTVIDSSLVSPEDTYNKHLESVEFIRQTLRTFRDHPTVVVTHHAPSAQSVHEKYRGDLLNSAFYSDLSELILTYEPAVWAHGHMHDSSDYLIGGTRVLCNPLGYYGYDTNKQFNPNLVMEI